MTHTRRLGLLLPALLLATMLSQDAFGQAAPVLKSAVSRRLHGPATFDIPLPITGTATGIECRQLYAGVTIVLTFDKAVGAGTATVASGTATVASTAISQGTLYINLSNVGNAQSITLNY